MSKPVVLFLGTGNSARSQMAEALLKWHAPGQFDIHSAGPDPQGINPLRTRVLNEIGIDISDQRSKSVSEFLGKMSISHAIFVCTTAEEKCPKVYPFALNKHSWAFDDPAACEGTEAEMLDEFRLIRDQIDAKICKWLSESTPLLHEEVM